jgi:prepilin peptidase CpaA
MTLLGFIAFNALLVCAALSDIRRYCIPNLLPLLLALAIGLAPPMTLGDLASHALSAALIGAATTVLWLRGWLGGGDLKLLTACGLWMPFSTLSVFLVALGVASGLQGLAAFFLASKPSGRAHLPSALRRRIPYGLSIAAAGAIWSVVQIQTTSAPGDRQRGAEASQLSAPEGASRAASTVKDARIALAFAETSP